MSLGLLARLGAALVWDTLDRDRHTVITMADGEAVTPEG